MSSKTARISASDSGLSHTTTRFGVLDDARTNPHAPLSKITRAPLAVTTFLIGRPPSFSPALNLATSLATRRSSVPYFSRSEQYGDIVDVAHVFGNALRRSGKDMSGLRSISLQISTATRMPQS